MILADPKDDLGKIREFSGMRPRGFRKETL